jgi:hypothetical protein
VVARPDDVCPEQRPAGLESSGVVAVVDTASRHATASVAAVQQAVSTHPVSASGIRPSSRPVSGVRSPGWSRGPALGRLLSSRLLSSRPVSSRLVSAPHPSGRVRILPPQAVALGPGRAGRATVTTGTGGGLWLPSRRRLDRRSRRPGRGRRCRTRVGQWEVAGGPGPPGGVRAAAAALAPLRDQPGQAGLRSARRGRLRCGHRGRWQHEVAAAAGWLASSAGCATTVGGRRRA